ncbi:MAG: discoidin domain-containing protein [Actinomycetota bacterium]
MVAAIAVVAALLTVVPLVAGWSLGQADAAGGGIDNVVPKPVSVTAQGGTFTVGPSTRILYATRSEAAATEQSLQPLADVLALELELITGIRPAVAAGGSADAAAGDIVLAFDAVTAPAADEAAQVQAYRLDVTDRAVISSEWYKGVAYGTTTLTQALVERDGSFQMPGVVVEDRPASEFRTVMIDIARQRHSVETLREVVDMLRQYKTRYLHLHLTDDQNFVFPFGPVTDNVDGNYTISRADFEALVAYADARGVTIIPELDLPGHSTKVKRSGYVSASNDFEVASPQNYGAIKAIIDDMLSVFASSPYFHIGGDESSAGDALVPFLAEMNRHVRSLDRRMLVWEGFHGAPAEIPATGDDRVVVLAWEGGRYNTPWNLLESGYEVINASWAPMYVVGNGSPLHMGGQVRKWSPAEIHAWDAETFTHWAGTPVFDDRGPNDPDTTDSAWKASYIGRQDQVLGGQMLFWEQAEFTVVDDLRDRLPVMSERLWNPAAGSFEDFDGRWRQVDDRVMTMVRPIDILPNSMDPDSPITDHYRIYEGDSLEVTFRNRSRIEGTIHYETTGCCGDPSWIQRSVPDLPSTGSAAYGGSVTIEGANSVRARLFRPDGTPVGGASMVSFANWPQMATVTEYDIGRGEFSDAPNTDDLAGRELRTYRLPTFRGPVTQKGEMLQRIESTLVIEQGGSYTLGAQTSTGRASIWIDLNRNGSWEDNERIIANTPTNETRITSNAVNLEPGEYAIRGDHLSLPPLPTLITYLNGPDTGGEDAIVGKHLKALDGSLPPAPEPGTPAPPRPAPPAPPAPPTTTAPPAPPATEGNVAKDKPVAASSMECAVCANFAVNAVDGDPTTRWSSVYADPQWIEVDLRARHEINRVRILWEDAYAKGYAVQLSDDRVTWQDVAVVTDGDGGEDDLTGLTGAGRYLRIVGSERGSPYGYSMWELEAFGQALEEEVPLSANVSRGKPVRTSSLEVPDALTGPEAVDGNLATRWSSAYADAQWLEVDLGESHSIDRVVIRWERAFGKGYAVQVSDDQENWTDLYTTTDGDGGMDMLPGLTGSGRYVRLLGNERGTGWGFSPWEFEVYGRPGATATPSTGGGTDPAPPPAPETDPAPAPPAPANAAVYHGVKPYNSFSQGTLQYDAWTSGEVAFYAPAGQVPEADGLRWVDWYRRADELYERMSTKDDFDAVYRGNDPNFGRVKVLGIVETCGAGCGNKLQAEADPGYLPKMVGDPTDPDEHWIFFYEMGRTGSRGGFEDFYAKATWPTNTLIVPHMMAAASYYELGGEELLRNGNTKFLFEELDRWEQENIEYVDNFTANDQQSQNGWTSHHLMPAMLLEIMVDTDFDTLARILENMSNKPEAQNATQAMCDFQDAVNAATGGAYADRMKGEWGLPDACP